MFIVRHFCIIFLYTLGIYLFGAYIRMQWLAEVFTCFACEELDQPRPFYDYIVVGMGSAGSTVALRLSEDKDVSVLVLEAGIAGNKLMDIPAVGPLLQKTLVDWQYRTVPQKNACLALESKASNWPMGCVMGGTSRLNNMVYLRGHPTDFKNWYQYVRNFNYERDILSYFRKAENSMEAENNDTISRLSGHLFIERLPFVSSLEGAFLKAVALLGYPVRDLNSDFPYGFMQTPVSGMHRGSRWTTAHHLYSQNRPNLLIRTNAHANRVLLKANFEAYAVEYSYMGSLYYARALKGVVVCAGVIGTPKLLMLSGIGPEQHLAEVGIKSRIDLPVGNNLQDHITTGLDLVILNRTLEVGVGNLVSLYSAFQYLYSGTGPWTLTGSEVVGLLDTDSSTYCLPSIYKPTYKTPKNKNRDAMKARPPQRKSDNEMKREDWSDVLAYTRSMTRTDILEKYLPTHELPDYELSSDQCPFNPERAPDLGFMMIPLGISADSGGHFAKAMGINKRTWYAYFEPLKRLNTISILPVVLHPKSRGTVKLSDSNPQTPPLIDPNYLSHHEDINVLIKGIRIVQEIVATEPMQKFGARLNEMVLPGCENHTFDSVPYWQCYVQHLTMTAYHPVGTAKMGPINDSSTVVNYHFKVHNTNKLYVVDGSVLPSLPSANVNAAIVMMAERAADIIKRHKYLSNHCTNKREVLVPNTLCEIF